MTSEDKTSIQLLQGTHDLMVLRTLALSEEADRWRKMSALVEKLLTMES
jgi:hypothetical protein